MKTTVIFTIDRTWDAHPARPDEVARVVVTLARGDDADAPDSVCDLTLLLEAPFHGDPAPDAPPGPLDGLWAFEVVEFFLVGPGPDDARPYLELEFGPHGHFLVLRLQGRRQAVERALPLDCAITRDGDRWRATAHVPHQWLPPRPWTANAFAIHGTGEARRYLCAHPTGGAQPDFHRLETFPVLDLP